MAKVRLLVPLLLICLCGRSFGQKDDFGTIAPDRVEEAPPCAANCPPTGTTPQAIQPLKPQVQGANSPQQSPPSTQTPQLTPVQQAQQYSQAASAAMDAKNYDTALQLINEARQLDPNNPQLQQQLVAYQELTKKNVDPSQLNQSTGGAFQDLQSSNPLPNSESFQTQVNLGQTRAIDAANGQSTTAPASNVAAQSEAGQTRLAYQKMSIGDYVGAENILTNVLHQNPSNWTAHTLLAKTFLHQPNPDYEGARMEANGALNIHANDSDMLEALAGALIHLVKNDTAVNELKQYLTGIANENRRMAEANFILSQAYRRAGQHQQELRNLSDAASYDPEQFSKLYDQALEAYDRQSNRKTGSKSGYPRWGGWLAALLLLGGTTAFVKQLSRSDTAALAARRAAPNNTSTLAGNRVAFGSAQAQPERPAPWLPGTWLLNDKFKIMRRLGSGGMGEVFEAWEEDLGRPVALKKMHDTIAANPKERAWFLKEARTVAQLRHANIIEIHRVIEDTEPPFLVFEYVEGKTLQDLIDEKKRIPIHEAMAYLGFVGSAMDYAHSRGVIHRDLKPANIMIREDGAVKVMDFGIAWRAQETLARLTGARTAVTHGRYGIRWEGNGAASLTKGAGFGGEGAEPDTHENGNGTGGSKRSLTIVGTPLYMAPEMEVGSAAMKESDIYALGICLYEMLTGKLPFGGSALLHLHELKQQKFYQPVSSAALGLPKALDEVFDRVLDPNPTNRYHSAREFIKAVAAAMPPTRTANAR